MMDSYLTCRRHRRLWTREDYALLDKLWGKARPEDIARQLERSFLSVMAKAWQANKKKKVAFYTQQQDAVTIAMRGRGATFASIGTAIGRSGNSVISRWHRCLKYRVPEIVIESRGRAVPSLPRLKFLEGAL